MSAIMAGIASAVAGSATSHALNKDSNAPQEGAVTGVESSQLGQREAQQATAPTNTEGALSKKLGQDFAEQAFQKGIDSVLNPRMNGKDAGKYQRDYLEAAFPSMNEWERAGASATSAGQAAAEQESQEKLQSKAQASQERMNRETTQAQLEVAKTQERTAKYVADSNNQTSRANTQDNIEAQKEVRLAQVKQMSEQVRKSMYGSGRHMQDFDSFMNLVDDTLNGKTQATAKNLNKIKAFAVRLKQNLPPAAQKMIDQIMGQVSQHGDASSNSTGNVNQGDTLKGDIIGGDDTQPASYREERDVMRKMGLENKRKLWQ